jgi:outer membrane protein assembly factor BamB
MACSSGPAQAPGLLLVVSSPDIYFGDDYDALQITVGSHVETKSGKDVSFPTTVGISGAARGPLKIEVRAMLKGVVRVAGAVRTTAPDHAVVLPIVLSAACRDRCVQVDAATPLQSYCDSKTRACLPEAQFEVPVSSLAPYDPNRDATKGLASIPCGKGPANDEQACNGTDFGALTCNAIVGEASTGDLQCVGCRGAASSGCSNPNGLSADAAWPMPGRTTLHQGRADVSGPRSAPPILKPLRPESIGAPFSSPVIDANGTVWLTSSFYSLPQAPPNANFAGAVVSIVGDKVNIFQPDPETDCRLDLKFEAIGSKGCRWSMPVIADDGTMWAMTNTGEGFRFTSADTIKHQPALSVLDALSASCANQSYCNVTQLGAVVRTQGTTRLAYVPTGSGVMVFKSTMGKGFIFEPGDPFLLQCPSWENRMPAIGPDGTLYVSLQYVFNQTDQHLAVCAIDGNGVFKWRSPDAKGLTTIPVIGSDGMVYFGSADHRLYALDPKAPKAFAWTFPTGGATTSPAIGVDGTLYFGSEDENLYAIDPSDQSVKWTLRVQGAIDASPVIDGDGTIFFGTIDRQFYGVNPNGTILLQTYVGSPVAQQAAISAEGTVYFGSTDGLVFSIPK